MASSNAHVLRYSRRHVVTAFIRGLHSTYLLVQRSDAVGSYTAFWGGVSGGMEHTDRGDTLGRAYLEIEEEVGYTKNELAFVRHGRPLLVDDGPSRHFWVQPFLFDLHSAREPRLNWENVQARFYTREEMKTLQTVPLLVETLDRVAVTENTLVEQACQVLQDDRDHGAAELCLIALEELRKIVSQGSVEDFVGVEAYMSYVRNAAWHLASTRENMAPIANGLALALADAVPKILKNGVSLLHDIESAKTVVLESIEEQERALRTRNDALIEQSCRVIESLATRHGGTTKVSIMTLSLSSTVTRVIQGLIDGGIAVDITVCESRPLCEGVVAAKQFHAMGAETVTLITDAQLASYIEKSDIALCGADSLTARGFVNKVGTHTMALHARQARTKMIVLSDLMKASPGPVFDVVSGKETNEFQSEEKGPEEVSDVWMTMGLLDKEDVSIHGVHSGRSLNVCNSYFEETPYELADVIISHQGILRSKDIQEYIQELEGVYLSAFVW